MAQAGAHLTDRVFPGVPVRQWVVSFPYPLRPLLAANASVLSAAIRIVMRVVLGWHRQRGAQLGCSSPQPGAVSILQRFGGSLNLNCHLHIIAIDGAFNRSEHTGAPTFQFARAPTQQDIQRAARSIGDRVCKWLRRRRLSGLDE